MSRSQSKAGPSWLSGADGREASYVGTAVPRAPGAFDSGKPYLSLPNMGSGKAHVTRLDRFIHLMPMVWVSKPSSARQAAGSEA